MVKQKIEEIEADGKSCLTTGHNTHCKMIASPISRKSFPEIFISKPCDFFPPVTVIDLSGGGGALDDC